MSLQKDLKRRLGELVSEGYQVSYKKRKSHVEISWTPERRDRLKAAGFDVDSAPPFVICPSTPSDHRGLKNLETTLKRIGVGFLPTKKEMVAMAKRNQRSETNAAVLKALEAAPFGLTSSELATYLGWSYGRVQPSVRQLVAEDELVVAFRRTSVSATTNRAPGNVILMTKSKFSADPELWDADFRDRSEREARNLLRPVMPDPLEKLKKLAASVTEESQEEAPAPELKGREIKDLSEVDSSDHASLFADSKVVLRSELDSEPAGAVADARELIRMFLDLPMSVLVAPELERDLKDLRKVLRLR